MLGSRLVLVAASMLGTAGIASAQAPNETIDVGGWKVTDAHEKGEFQGCTAINTFNDGSMIGLAATKDVTLIIISEPKSGLTPDQKYQVKYHFDEAVPTTVQGQAKGSDSMFIPVPDADVATFMAAAKLTVSYGGIDYEEKLDGSKDAITAMATCMTTGAGSK